MQYQDCGFADKNHVPETEFTAAVLSAAEKLFSEKGFAGTSIGNISGKSEDMRPYSLERTPRWVIWWETSSRTTHANLAKTYPRLTVEVRRMD